MKRRCNVRRLLVTMGGGLTLLAFAGCHTVGSTAADVGLAGVGGVAGYHLADEKLGGAAAGAAVGLIGSRVVQAETKRDVRAAEQRGYDRGLNQAVKQHYWIIQNQQRSRDDSAQEAVRLVPVVIPETQLDGVIQKARVEYLRIP